MGIETFVEPSWKLHRSADEAIMNFARQGHRKIPLEALHENEALEASETPPAEVVDHTEKSTGRPDIREWKVQIVPGQLKEGQGYPVLIHHNILFRHAQQSVRHQMDLSEISKDSWRQ